VEFLFVFILFYAVHVVIIADIGINLSVTGSNVGTAVKAEHQPVNVEDGHQHSMVHSRPASKWCTYCASDCVHMSACNRELTESVMRVVAGCLLRKF